jgi:hypothetical protein
MQTFLKFAVSGLTGAPQSATLRLFAYDGSNSGGSIYSVSNTYGNSSNLWTETGINWANRPTIAGSPLDTVGSVGTGTWAEYDVTDAISGNGTYSFGLVTASNNLAGFRSRQGATNKPDLAIVP